MVGELEDVPRIPAEVVAGRGVEIDVAERSDAMTTNANEWVDRLEKASGEARERATAALADLETALAEIATDASAAAWVRSGKEDGRWDRQPPAMQTGRIAPSSRRRTANGEALVVTEVLAYCQELDYPPPPPERLAVAEPQRA